jgi:23S rRNA (uridine2552-2'-O)-methyltransferase
MAFKRKDHFYKRAKREGKASRAVYKLSELQKRFKLIGKGDTVIDLGCAPGGWMQDLAEIVGPTGSVVGIDLLPLKVGLPKQCHFIQGDINDEAALAEIEGLTGGKVDSVLSDMSPDISGIAFADAYRSYELSLTALEFASRMLKPGGNFVVKIFPGEEFAAYVAELKRRFTNVKSVIPEATRKTSSERYLVAQGYKSGGSRKSEV